MSIVKTKMISCIQCGQAQLEPKLVQLPGVVRGENYTVEMMGLECPRCGYKTIEGPDMPEYGRLLADHYRNAHRLLTSEEIRERRKRLDMSQQEFARFLGVGIASVKRWEMGKIQDAESNRCILEKTQTPAYALDAWKAHFNPIITSTFQYYAGFSLGPAENEGSFSANDFTGLPYGQPHYTDQTIDLNAVRIVVDDREDFHVRYRTAGHTEARRPDFCSRKYVRQDLLQ